MKDEFLKELQDLLKKYNVSIGFNVSDCSDTHGLYDERMVISRYEPGSYQTPEIWLEVDGYSLDHYDIDRGD